MRDVALKIPLRPLALGWLLQSNDPGGPRIHMFSETLDRAPLAGRVAAFEQHDDALSGLLDPALRLEQLALEFKHMRLVRRGAHGDLVGIFAGFEQAADGRGIMPHRRDCVCRGRSRRPSRLRRGHRNRHRLGGPVRVRRVWAVYRGDSWLRHGSLPRRMSPRNACKSGSTRLEREITRRVDAGRLEELAQRRNLLFRKGMTGTVKSVGMSVELHHDMTMAAMSHFAAERLDHGIGQPRVDITADRVGEQGMQRIALLVVHRSRDSRRYRQMGRIRMCLSLIHVKPALAGMFKSCLQTALTPRA